MYRNIGKKIKTLAKVFCWVGMIVSILGGGYTLIFGIRRYIALKDSMFLLLAASGVVGAAVGCLLAWVGNFLLYGFGELIDKTTEIAENTRTGF